MEKIPGRIAALILAMALALGGCGDAAGIEEETGNVITDNSTPEELYERALKEDILVV